MVKIKGALFQVKKSISEQLIFRMNYYSLTKSIDRDAGLLLLAASALDILNRIGRVHTRSLLFIVNRIRDNSL